VHGEDFRLGHQVVHHREYRFLDFPGVACAANNGKAPAKVENDEGLGIRPIQAGHGMELRHVDHRELRHMVDRPPFFGPKEHGAGKQTMPCRPRDDSDGHAVGRIGARKTILNVEILHLQVGQQAVIKRVEFCVVKGPVDLAPPHLILAALLADDELIIGRAARVVAGSHGQRSLVAEEPLAPAYHVLVKGRGGKIQKTSLTL